MRFARKLVLLAAMALAALALTATSASAQEPIEIQTELGEHCGGICDLHVVGTAPSNLSAYFGGTPVAVISSCNDEFVASLDENGVGYIHTYENDAAASATCTRVNCASETESEWPTRLEEFGPGDERAHVVFCLSPETDPSTETHCEVEIDIDAPDPLNPHHYLFNAVNEHCGFVPNNPNLEVRLNGQWESENTDWELVH
jgi:hypothetical protein